MDKTHPRRFTFTIEELRLIKVFRQLSPGERRGLLKAAQNRASVWSPLRDQRTLDIARVIDALAGSSDGFVGALGERIEEGHNRKRDSQSYGTPQATLRFTR